MDRPAIRDWDDAYENTRHIPGGAAYPARWAEMAARFRDTARGRTDIPYGTGPRHVLDLFLPPDPPRGLFVFVHGGYWTAFDKSLWSHLAREAVAAGWACAIPSYDLCPTADIAGITAGIGAAVDRAAAEVAGPVILSGHSAGGHLVTAMMCDDTPLGPDARARLRHVVSISGLHDLRPLLRTARNADLRLTEAGAAAQSPALKRPLSDVPLTAWVGAEERPEFLRQAALLANVWHGLGIPTREVTDPGRHHFDVIAGLGEAQSPLIRAALGGMSPE